ncbi:unannotated protein [freshwater metagenome]|uniref:Unannotated protein n=1 Tax=freshwater metagenome TaxID=449393 RepID=A0A6J7I365_9ZZZZ|nr:thioredoxin [Actinomycetota bacterium]
MTVIDVTQTDFQREVLDRSHTVPVVVDFWAAWCGPCRALTPILEAAANARDGQVVLAKVDTDANQEISQSFGIQGIPAVKAFRDGVVVDEFVGAQPPAAVERFFDGLVPSATDLLVAAGDEASLREALALHPGRADAAVALAGLLHRRGEEDEALEVLRNVPGNLAAEGLVSRIALERAGDIDVSAALAALDAGDQEGAADLLIGLVAPSSAHNDDLRRVIIAALDALGVEHEGARQARRRLAAALY